MNSSISFPSQLKEVQRFNEDYEWYPTTDEILARMAECLEEAKEERRSQGRKPESFLDIGAGNGKVLDFIKSKSRDGETLMKDFYAIEKSQTHLSNLDSSYLLLGVDFHKVTLLDKEIDVVFCNPPYSEYEAWAAKIIKEAPLNSLVYLVIPERWENSKMIRDQLASRNIKEPKIKGSYSFEDSEDRKARAKVHLLEIDMGGYNWREEIIDPFERFFDENFTYAAGISLEEQEPQNKEGGLVHRESLIEVLASGYEERMQTLHRNYSAICSLDSEILEEFEITKGSLMESLKMKLESAKKRYWQHLFDGLEEINERLTSISREKIVAKMKAHSGVEFNRENAYAVVLWVIKNANEYFDSQLIDTYERLVSLANAENYKSNQRVFNKHQFTYSYRRNFPDEVSHYKIRVGHRVVLDNCGGIVVSYGANRGLSQAGCNMVNDLLVIANNLGFTPLNWGPPGDGWNNEWKDSEPRVFACKYKGETHTLMRVRAFFNGNMHFQFLPEFIHALNVQHGRLKGWIGSAEEAEREMDAPKEIASKFIDYKFRIENNQLLLST